MYISLVVKLANKESVKTFHAHCATQVTNDILQNPLNNWASLMRKVKNLFINDHLADVIFFPRYENYHFTLFVWFGKRNTVRYYDSLYRNNTPLPSNMIKQFSTFITECHKLLKEQVHTIPKFEVGKIEIQPDGTSCGVYVCLKAEEIGTKRMLFNELKTVTQKRTYIVKNVLNNADEKMADIYIF